MTRLILSDHLNIIETLSVPYVYDVSISNDGNFVVMVVNRADWKDNKFVNHIWIYDHSQERLITFIDDNIGAEHPRWSWDSRSLAYLRAVDQGVDEGTQIFVKQDSSMIGTQITYAKCHITTFRWDPDGKGIYFLGSQYTEKVNRREEEYGPMEYVDTDFALSSLFFVDLDNAFKYSKRRYRGPMNLEDSYDDATKPFIEGFRMNINNFDISPDSQFIVIDATRTPFVEDDFHHHIYSLNTQTKEVSLLLEDIPIVDGPLFSPTGKKICFTRYSGTGRAYENIVLQIFDLQSGNITEPIEIDESIRLVRWTRRGIVIQWQERTTKHIGFLSSEGKITTFTTDPDGYVYGAFASMDGQYVTYLQATSSTTSEVYVNGTKITNQSKYYIGKEIIKKQVISWKSHDGTEIEGVLSYPPGFTSSKKYPLLIFVHGGPTWTAVPIQIENRYYPLDLFAQRGFLILEPNYRGSAGYGSYLRGLNVGNLGIGDYQDIISGIDALIQYGYIDETQVGIMGWSQGGYIAAFCATFSDRFKAASVGAGISDWVTYYSGTDAKPFTLHYLGQPPWKHRGVYDMASPITYVNQASTPVLIQHGDQDNRVPVSNAFALYRALRDKNIDTRLVIFEGMGHGSSKPSWNYAIMLQNLAWFRHYLLNSKIEEFWP